VRTFLKGALKVLAFIAGVLLVVGAILRIFFVDLAVVGHNAMAPTLIAGDEILVWRGVPDFGDVTICQHPGDPSRLVIGRLVGKPGMTLDTQGGQLRIDRRILERDRMGEVRFRDGVNDRTDEMNYGLLKLGNTEHHYFERQRYNFTFRPVTIGDGVWLLSDNRSYPGEDSRSFGEVDIETCIGDVFMRLQPSPDPGSDLEYGWLDIID
jgi:signal peptidase I